SRRNLRRCAKRQPHGVHHSNGSNNHPVVQGDGSGPHSPFVFPPAEDGAGAGPHVAAFDVVFFLSGGSGGSRRVAHLFIGSGRKVAAATQIEDGGRRHNWNKSAG